MALKPDFGGIPLRLYVDHDPTVFPDAILLSEATIAFAKGVKELSFILDPSERIDIGIFPSEEGSFWQNAFLKAQQEYHRRLHLYHVAAAAMIWFVQPPLERIRSNAWAPILDKYMPEITTTDRAKAFEKVADVATGQVAEAERRAAYQAFSRDPAVNRVGVNVARVRPPVLIPRSDFFTFAGAVDVDVFGEERTTISLERAILVSPVLEIGTRRWKLKTSKGEIGATIKDRKFLEMAVGGRLAVPLSGGIRMDVRLETQEKAVDGLWRPIEHHVIEVLNVEAPPTQGGLF